MCQINNKLVKLRKDRVAYKVLYRKGRRWLTPNHNINLKRNKIITAKRSASFYGTGEIRSGYFHSFALKSDAIKITKSMNHCGFYEFRCFKCIIPKTDNTVYTGTFNSKIKDNTKSICAIKIILTDEVVE